MKNSRKVMVAFKAEKKLVLIKAIMFMLFLCGGASYSQMKLAPGAEDYAVECQQVYTNAYRNGFSCAAGNKNLCSRTRPQNQACEAASIQGYNEGYLAGNQYKETNKIKETESISDYWKKFLESKTKLK